MKVIDVKKALPTPPDSVVGDDDHRQEQVPLALDESSAPCEKTAKTSEIKPVVPLVEQNDDAASSDGYETAVGDDEEWQSKCEEKKMPAKAPTASKEQKEEDPADDDATLWPPYQVKAEEFVVVRDERIISAEEDPLLDAALSLLS